jgi:hypothetical protein
VGGCGACSGCSDLGDSLMARGRVAGFGSKVRNRAAGARFRMRRCKQRLGGHGERWWAAGYAVVAVV